VHYGALGIRRLYRSRWAKAKQGGKDTTPSTQQITNTSIASSFVLLYFLRHVHVAFIFVEMPFTRFYHPSIFHLPPLLTLCLN